MDPATPGLTPQAPQRPPQRDELDPVDRRLTAGLLALLLGFVVAIATFGVVWSEFRDDQEPPTNEVILWSLLVLALWIALWVGVFYWGLSRRR